MSFTPQELLAHLSQLEKKQRLIVAYSGGLDSHVLLHGFAQLRDSLTQPFILEALHVHHGLSDYADDWAAHCQYVCDQLSVPLTVRHVRAEMPQASLENQLRELRYQVFIKVLNDGDLLALAHHADDQVETMMLRMLRGTGPQGLAGMPSQRYLGQGMLIRPLLEHCRSELESYAQHHGLSWVEDDSNADTRFDRNYLRHEVMPKLARRWPYYRKNFFRNAQVNKDALSSLDYFLERELQPQIQANETGLDCAWLLGFPTALQINLLRSWLNIQNLPLPGYKHLQQVLTEVVAVRVDAQSLVSWPGVEVRRFQGIVYANKPLPAHDASKVYKWRLDKSLLMAGSGLLKAEPAVGRGVFRIDEQAEVCVRFRQGGERCKLAGRDHSKLLKKQLNSLQVPPWLRDRLPLIYVDGELAALGDVAICEGFQASEGQAGYVLSWQRP